MEKKGINEIIEHAKQSHFFSEKLFRLSHLLKSNGNDVSEIEKKCKDIFEKSEKELCEKHNRIEKIDSEIEKIENFKEKYLPRFKNHFDFIKNKLEDVLFAIDFDVFFTNDSNFINLIEKAIENRFNYLNDEKNNL